MRRDLTKSLYIDEVLPEKMPDKQNGFLLLASLLFLYGPCAYGDLPAKCKLHVGKAKTFSITNWTWKIVKDKPQKAYYINICGRVNHESCNANKDSSVCSTSTDGKVPKNMGSVGHTRVLNSTSGTGFILQYTGVQGDCEMGSHTTWITNIFMRCGKFLGSPQFVDISVAGSSCVANFEFATNEACKTPSKIPEIPCSLYGKDNKLRDLTPLIKLKGGHKVSSSISNFDFHINVCRGITAEKTGDTQDCPTNSSMCRIDKKLQTTKDLGNINYASSLHFSPQNDIILVYSTKKKVDGCFPVTTITFKCSKQMGSKGPLLTAAHDCAFEVLWETDFACPQSSIMSTNSCVLRNEFVNFDLTPLTTAKLSYHVIKQDTVNSQGQTNHYRYYINVCKALDFDCGGINSTVCQGQDHSTLRRSLGDISTQKMQYADGHLTLTYDHGTPCANGLNRTTVIFFKCDYHVGKGEPVFLMESYCFYFFSWTTKYACPPSRRTGTACRVESASGVRYDLSELVRMENASNWVAVDGESSISNKLIFINVCGQLTPRTETKQCDSGSAICMIDKGKVVSLGKYTNPPTLSQDNSIKLVYTQGSECKKDNLGKSITRNSTITFVCQPGDLESPPVLVSHTEDDCQYQFMWKSAAACSLGLNVGDNCKVEDKDAGYVFDLTPLATHKWEKKDFYSVKSTSQYEFQLKVCGGSKSTDCSGSDVPVGSCQIKKQDRKYNWILGQPNQKLYYYDGMLNLTYGNGTMCHNGVYRTTHITFLCNSSAADDGIGVPEYQKETYCVYNFRWFTKYACPAKTTECVARSEAHQYDLASLVRTKDNWKAAGGGGTFYINVCRSLNLGPLVSGCSGTAAICFKKDDGTAVNLGAVADAPHFEGKNMVIMYINGDKCPDNDKQRFETKITFICDHGSMGTSPSFIETVGCTFKFEWKTEAACAITNVEGDNCAVKDPKSSTTFNLLPLLKRKGLVYSGNMTDNKEQGTFELNICGPVPACGMEKVGIGACLTKNGAKIVLGKVNKHVEYKGEIVTLVYREGDTFDKKTGQQREVHIKFFCNPKKLFGEPAFSGQERNKYFFVVQTSLVCSPSAVQCTVSSSDGKSYDLTPLGLNDGNWEAVDTRPQDKHLHYFINICRPVNLTPELMKCPGGGIGACQIDHKSKKGFNLGYLQSNPQIAANGELSLQYFGGSGCHQQFNRSIRIVFSCSKIRGSPIFLSESPECEYLFSWQTPSACPLTLEHGSDCTVEDRQYGYMFNLYSLYNKDKDYNVSVSGAPGLRIILNVCNKLVKIPKGCSGKNVGACILNDPKPESIALNNNLTYYNGHISTTYGKSPSLNFTFECNPGVTGRETGPKCEKKKDNYECLWQTAYACRPMISSVQCSIRNEDGSVDDQYDYSPLSKSERNWLARIPGPNHEGVAYFINVCQTVILQKVARRCPPTAGVCMVKGTKYYNLGTIMHGPRKENGNIYLLYENGDDCGGGKKYSSRIQMECGDTEGEPVYVTMSKQTCVYEFLWITSTACPVNTKNQQVFDNCTAVNPRTKVLFNLQSLKKNDGDYLLRDVKDNRTSFALNVCRGLVKPNGCDGKSGVCKHMGKQTYNAGKANSRLYFDDGVLYLNLSGGDVCHHWKKNRETIVQFVCNSCLGERNDLGKPVFISENDCTYFFVWHTSLVCETQYECAATKQVRKDSTISTIKHSLGRLMRTNANWLVTSEDGVDDSYNYYVNLCRPLVPMPGTNCPAGAWACRVSKQVDQAEGKHEIQSLGRAYNSPRVDDSGEVRLVYKSSTACKREDDKAKLELHFTFTCAYGSLGHPVLLQVDKCIIHISWATSAACPEAQTAELDKCRVFDNSTGQYYSLKPLAKNTNGLTYYKVGSENHPPYFLLSICGGLHLNQDGSSCTGSGVCLVSQKTSKKTYKPLGLYAHRTMTYFRDEGMLILKYCSAACDSKENVTISRIIFVCDRTQRGNGNPELNTFSKDGAIFVWRTSLVCPPLEEECSYVDGNSNYNLQLLTSRTRSWYYEHNKDRFWINICRGISDGPPGCPVTASVCMKRGGSDKVNIVGLTSTQRMSMKGGRLQLTYSGLPPVEGCSSGLNSKVVFYFECGNHIGQPQFEREDWSSCSFIIKWRSSVACKTERKEIEKNNCTVKHPVTGRGIDFKRLVNDSKSTWKVAGKDENNHAVSFFINVCGNVGDGTAPEECNNKVQLCEGNTPLHVQSKKFYYEDLMFSLEMTTKDSGTVVINFQCSAGEGVGSPKFDYVSSNKHFFFTWPTSIVCSEDLSHEMTDIPEAGHKKAESATKKNVGVTFGVLFAVLLIVVFAVVMYKPSRRHSIISCVRMNFKTHVLRKEIEFPVHRYQKLNVADDDDDDDDEADSLIKQAEGSDKEVENDDDAPLPF